MIRYIIKRILQLIPVILGVAIIIFTLIAGISTYPITPSR